jgi:nucleoside-diphosphate-sugar epimerase
MARVLVLGGSWFLGRAVVDAARRSGSKVVIFRRGRVESGPDPQGVHVVHGDYGNPDEVRHLTEHGSYDVVVDCLAFTPRETLAVARTLEPVVGRYVIISSVSAYRDWPMEPLTEESPTLECPPDAGPEPGYNADPGPTTYGFGKAGCERAVLTTFDPDRSVILRPGVILGPGEYVGRTAWWLDRFRRGGAVVAPHPPMRSIQPIDVRDVADFALTAPAGVFNVTAEGNETFADFLAACVKYAPAPPEGTTIEYVSPDILTAHGVRQWTGLPLWRTYAGAWAVDSSAGRAAGLRTRPIAETVRDTVRWREEGGAAVNSARAGELGIDAVTEAAVLADHRTRLRHG